MTSPDNAPSPAGIENAPLEFPPAIDPIFWGTGDLLVWDSGNLVQTVDKLHLFRKIWALDTLSDAEYTRMAAEVFEPLFTELTSLISEEGLIDPRGFYGFFPVISDTSSLVLIDPSDFHSELLTIPCPKARKLGGRSLADFYRPEGDVLAVSALTLGPLFDRYLDRMEIDPVLAKKAGFLRGIGTLLIEVLFRKITGEVRRGLGIDATAGVSLIIGGGIVDVDCRASLLEVLGVEERLGIMAKEFDRYSPVYSTIGLLVQHPQVNDFIHFGT
jgi:cobalamin-dependent methionine synthase I